MAASDEIRAISKLPKSPAVYALYAGRNKRAYVAYVGIASKNLRVRIFQHLVTRDSSISTGVSAVGLNPDHVTEIRWWTDQRFHDNVDLAGAELVAFDILDPALRSRGRVSEGANSRYSDKEFQSAMRKLFSEPPTGALKLPDVKTRLTDVERQLDKVLERLSRLEKHAESSES